MKIQKWQERLNELVEFCKAVDVPKILNTHDHNPGIFYKFLIFSFEHVQKDTKVRLKYKYSKTNLESYQLCYQRPEKKF